MDNVTFNKAVSVLKKNKIPTCGNKSFSQLTTLGCGGKIKLAIYPANVRQLVKTIRCLDKFKIDYIVLGKGSNILASDREYDGAVVSTANIKRIKIKGDTVVVEAGASTVTLAGEMRKRGLSGGEFFACLPASAGGAVVCNAGCYGQDVQSVLASVKVLQNGRVRVIPADKCGLAKRNSIFKNNRNYVVLSAKFKLTKSSPDAVSSTISEMRRRKADSQPLNYRSAGCVLYHDKVAVSRLIDEANLKGYTVGGAQVSSKHAGFVVNVDKAESKDVYLIIKHIIDTLYARYGVLAKTEVCLVNFTKDERNDLFAGS